MAACQDPAYCSACTAAQVHGTAATTGAAVALAPFCLHSMPQWPAFTRLRRWPLLAAMYSAGMSAWVALKGRQSTSTPTQHSDCFQPPCPRPLDSCAAVVHQRKCRCLAHIPACRISKVPLPCTHPSLPYQQKCRCLTHIPACRISKSAAALHTSQPAVSARRHTISRNRVWSMEACHIISPSDNRSRTTG